ncbi:hypothetical protein [uncultured Chryseobacterium sp.]|mgnify:CR=1 FL=1|jgi:hypothetical protein|uniref:hypothetical protein n=1 Tax=uncultured Chryseobacterium sp. TaxID=259322 RepID=UPI00261BCF6C|nr:hypothetical protein [uncultured Chryseobacterium sp.]
MEILDKIIYNSGDSILEKYSYSDGILAIDLNLTELEKKVKIRIRTDNLSFNDYYVNKKEDLYRTCRIEFQELLNILSLENSIYVPSKDFGRLMRETRLRLNLAYGKKSSEIKYIFSLVGYDRLITCTVSDLACIHIE